MSHQRLTKRPYLARSWGVYSDKHCSRSLESRRLPGNRFRHPRDCLFSQTPVGNIPRLRPQTSEKIATQIHGVVNSRLEECNLGANSGRNQNQDRDASPLRTHLATNPLESSISPQQRIIRSRISRRCTPSDFSRARRYTRTASSCHPSVCSSPAQAINS